MSINFPEVITQGRPIRQVRPELFPLRGNVPTVGGARSQPEGPRFEPPVEGFVAPPVPPVLRPVPVPEIIVRGTAVTRPPVGIGATPAVSAGALFAVVGGLLVANILREVSQQKLDEAGELALRPARKRPDSPLETMPGLDSVITVTAKRPTIPQSLFIAPQPQPLITPDADPFVLVPILPRVVPTQPAIPLPSVEIQTPTAPTIRPQRRIVNVPQRLTPSIQPQIVPLRTPFRFPRPTRETSPNIRPQTVPDVRPAVFPGTGTSPQVATNPLTSLRRRLAQSTRRQRLTAPQAQTVPASAGGQCPPCPPCRKDEKQEQMRDECYKKLVKEGLFPSFDSDYKWVEIDCLTGREL